MVVAVDTAVPDVKVICGIISSDPYCRLRYFATLVNSRGEWAREFISIGEFQAFLEGVALGYEMFDLPLPKDFGKEVLEKARREADAR